MDEKKTDESSVTQEALLPSGSTPAPKQDKPDRATVKAYRKQGKEEGAQYLKEKKACNDASEMRAFRKKWKLRKKELKASLCTMEPAEQKAQKKGMKAFRRRIHRSRRIRNSIIALALIACLVFFGWPVGQMLWRVGRSIRYTNSGSDVDIARVSAYTVSEEICDEGFVLLKNENNLLPLAEKKLNIFGDDAYRLFTGSGGNRAASNEAVSLTDALADHDILYNRDLDRSYQKVFSDESTLPEKIRQKATALFSPSKNDWHVPEESVMQKAQDYSSQALLVLSSLPKEGEKASLSGYHPMEEGTVRKQVIDAVCSNFDHVILVVSSGSAMELGFISEYDSIEAVIWIGSPGPKGYHELAKILTGEVNPSGRSADTWPVSLEASPSYSASALSYYANMSGQYSLSFSEGIYVGYRYFETRFGQDEQAYAENVVFPFGHGLSYTEFSQEITSFNEEDGIITAEVTVRNTGDAAGKDVIQLYFSAPYDPEKKTEKSAIELAAFTKTHVLEPGEETSVFLTIPVRDLAFWSEENGCYLLEAGDYRFAIGADVHDALLSEAFETYSVEEDILYRTYEQTGSELKHLFASARGDAELLSRAQWAEEAINSGERLVASDELKQAKKDADLPNTDVTRGASEPPYEKEGSVSLSDLKGLPYDDEKWDAFLDAFKPAELIRLAANGAYHTEAISRLGIPGTQILGEADGIRPLRQTLSTVSYPAVALIGTTWNMNLAAKYGETIAAEASAYGINGLYLPSAAIRRSPVSSPNGELFSEDPLLTGKMAASVAEAVGKKDILAFVESLPFSEAEGGFGKNVFTWIDEQTLRQIYLRPFEIALREGKPSGITASSANLGVEWCGSSEALLKDLIREEWGYEGIVSTGLMNAARMNPAQALTSGADLLMDPGFCSSEKILKHAYAKDPVSTAWALRECAHRICYTIVNDTNLCK